MIEYVASVSGGKDSIAMLFLIMSKGMCLDAVQYYDTGMEFDAIKRNMDFIEIFCKNNGIEFIRQYPERNFLYDMIEKPVKNHHGYSWCGGANRWGTTYKQRALDRIECKVKYIGIAADEKNRISKMKPEQIAPLYDCGITEKQALAYCRYLGFDWDENGIDLYDILDRVSCWCCRNKNQKELYRIWRYLPQYWEQLIKLQEKLPPMKNYHNSRFGDFGDLRRMQEVFQDAFFDKYKVPKYEP